MCNPCKGDDTGHCYLVTRRAVYFSLSVIGSKVVTTPATITLDKSQRSIDVVCKKRCFQDGFGVIPSHMEAMTAGDILVGGVVGLGVDAISGAMKKYDDNKQFTIVPIDGCHA